MTRTAPASPGHLRKLTQSTKFWRICAIAYAGVFFLIMLLRAFDNNFWGDECYTIHMAGISLAEMVATTAADVHPPLYYILVQLVCAVLGQNGFAYHFASILPYGIMLVFFLTRIWKRFGKEATFLLITLASVLESSYDYNVEARMYSWGALFVMLSFFALYDILTENKARHYVLFTLWSLAAAYTHYYCLISVAFFYLLLVILALCKRKEYLKKVFFSGLVTVLAYLPWMVVLLQTLTRTAGEYWITEIPTLSECMLYLFHSNCDLLLVLATTVIMGIAVAVSAGILTAGDIQEKKMTVALDFSALQMKPFILWCIAGVACVVGTALVGILISYWIRPMFLVRYLYPAATVAWCLLAVSLSKLPRKQLLAAILIGAMLLLCFPATVHTFVKQREENSQLAQTLKATENLFEEDDILLTDVSHINWTIADYYYPGLLHEKVVWSNGLELSPGQDYWFIAGSYFSQNAIDILAHQGYTFELVIQDGRIGTHTVQIYRLTEMEAR